MQECTTFVPASVYYPYYIYLYDKALPHCFQRYKRFCPGQGQQAFHAFLDFNCNALGTSLSTPLG